MMSLSNLSKLQILDIISVNSSFVQVFVLLVCLIEFFVFFDKKKFAGFFLGFYSLLLTPVQGSVLSSRGGKTNPVQEEKCHVSRGDLSVVLTSLCLPCEDIPAGLDVDGIVEMFEGKSVFSGEVKEAFDVFDENGDGFIDAGELGKVLCALGFGEGLDVERCRGMIGAFDENGDGMIDFGEFVKLMGYM